MHVVERARRNTAQDSEFVLGREQKTRGEESKEYDWVRSLETYLVVGDVSFLDHVGD